MHDPPETGIFAEIADVRTRPPAALPGDPASWLVVETPSRRVALKRFGDVQVLQDEARQIDLVVHGELYDGASLPGLISSYQDVGVSFVKECNGLFSILLVDRRKDRVILATDRLSSKPLHVRRVAGRTYVSSKLRHLVTCDSAPDRAGVAWYLCTGVVHMDGTVLAEVSRVPRASCCTLSDGGQRVTRYWNHEFTDEDGGRSFEQLRGDLADLLVACVKKRPGGDDGALLSLSAGNDSRGILGLLCHVGRRDSVKTFSYAAAEDIAGSDAAIAKRLADRCGVPHRLLLAYDGELDDAIERNARWGDGSANFCDEALVWETLVSEHASRRPPLICGDTVLVDYEVDVVDMQDTMNRAVRDFAGLAWIRWAAPGRAVRRAEGRPSGGPGAPATSHGRDGRLSGHALLAAPGPRVSPAPAVARGFRRSGIRRPGAVAGQPVAGLLAATAARVPQVPAATVRGGGEPCGTRGVHRATRGRQRLHHRLERPAPAAGRIARRASSGRTASPAPRAGRPHRPQRRRQGPPAAADGGRLRPGAGCAASRSAECGGSGGGCGARSPAASSPCGPARPTSSGATWS